MADNGAPLTAQSHSPAIANEVRAGKKCLNDLRALLNAESVRLLDFNQSKTADNIAAFADHIMIGHEALEDVDTPGFFRYMEMYQLSEGLLRRCFHRSGSDYKARLTLALQLYRAAMLAADRIQNLQKM
jgi:hypothetical protein